MTHVADCPVTRNDRPLVSVVIPTKNRKAQLLTALGALSEQSVGQCHLEVLVIDNGSTDGTLEAIFKFRSSYPYMRVRVFKKQTGGPGAARNLGIQHAAGEIILFTDDDCIAEPGWVAAYVNTFANDVAIVGVEGLTYTVVDDPTPFMHFAANAGGFFPTCNVGYRSALLRQVGGFDCTAFPGANKEDADLAYRMLEHGNVVFANEARVFHPVRRVTLMWQVRRMRRLLTDELSMMLRWPRKSRDYVEHNFAHVPATASFASPGAYVTAPVPMRGPALLVRLDWLRHRPKLYLGVLLLVILRSLYGACVLPGALRHAWKYRDPHRLPPLQALDTPAY
jgi:glycosyltransferase involved in cell wall biosynthesis